MKFVAALFSGRGAAIVGAVVLSACTVVEGPGPGPGPYPGPRPEPGARFCTREYQPVCARRGSERQTFPNSCEADRAGFRVIRNGQCRGDGGWDGGGGPGPWPGTRPPRPEYPGPGTRPPRPEYPGPGTRPPRPDPEQAFCTRDYRPVCATRRGSTRTFGNACEARAADYRIVDQNGPC